MLYVAVASEPHRERRGRDRYADIYARRRTGELRRHRAIPLSPNPERRRIRGSGFDVAEALELNLKSFPTKTGLLTLLRFWLYAAEREGLGRPRPDYAIALRHAVKIMEQCSEAVQAIALLHARDWEADAVV